MSPPVKAPVTPERSEEKVATPSTARVEEAPSEPPTSTFETKVEEAFETRPLLAKMAVVVVGWM